MGLLGVALGAGERLVTQLRGRSTKRFNKTLRPERSPPLGLALPPSASVSCAHVGTGLPFGPWPGRSLVLLPSAPLFGASAQFSAPYSAHPAFPANPAGAGGRPGTPGSGSSQPLSWGSLLLCCPQAPPGPLPPSRGAASRSPWGGAPAGGRFSASGPAAAAGEGVACGADGLARGPGSRRTVLFAVRRAPGLMAAPGTRGAGVAFAAQKEVVLERPCWLDGGCEQARRGYLYGQLCCVGGCGWRGGGAGEGARLRERGEGRGGRGRCPTQAQPRPQARC